MAAKKSPASKKKSRGVEEIIEANVKMVARTADVALRGYLELLKAMMDPRMTEAGIQIVDQVAEGWKTALKQSPKLLESVYASVARQSR